LLQSVHFPIWPLEPYDERWSAPRRGLWAERAVARQLWLANWQIRAHRWMPTTLSTDIDLVAANRTTLLFAEIKCRQPHDNDPWAEVLAPERVERLRKGIAEYLRTTRQLTVNLQVDGFLVIPSDTNKRRPVIERREAYLPARTIPGWLGIGAR
jgi:Holliday junction resolvase-like predicted endonuclease